MWKASQPLKFSSGSDIYGLREDARASVPPYCMITLDCRTVLERGQDTKGTELQICIEA